MLNNSFYLADASSLTVVAGAGVAPSRVADDQRGEALLARLLLKVATARVVNAIRAWKWKDKEV